MASLTLPLIAPSPRPWIGYIPITIHRVSARQDTALPQSNVRHLDAERIVLHPGNYGLDQNNIQEIREKQDSSPAADIKGISVRTLVHAFEKQEEIPNNCHELKKRSILNECGQWTQNGKLSSVAWKNRLPDLVPVVCSQSDIQAGEKGKQLPITNNFKNEQMTHTDNIHNSKVIVKISKNTNSFLFQSSKNLGKAKYANTDTNVISDGVTKNLTKSSQPKETTQNDKSNIFPNLSSGDVHLWKERESRSKLKCNKYVESSNQTNNIQKYIKEQLKQNRKSVTVQDKSEENITGRQLVVSGIQSPTVRNSYRHLSFGQNQQHNALQKKTHQDLIIEQESVKHEHAQLVEQDTLLRRDNHSIFGNEKPCLAKRQSQLEPDMNQLNCGYNTQSKNNGQSFIGSENHSTNIERSINHEHQQKFDVNENQQPIKIPAVPQLTQSDSLEGDLQLFDAVKGVYSNRKQSGRRQVLKNTLNSDMTPSIEDKLRRIRLPKCERSRSQCGSLREIFFEPNKLYTDTEKCNSASECDQVVLMPQAKSVKNVHASSNGYGSARKHESGVVHGSVQDHWTERTMENDLYKLLQAKLQKDNGSLEQPKKKLESFTNGREESELCKVDNKLTVRKAAATESVSRDCSSNEFSTQIIKSSASFATGANTCNFTHSDLLVSAEQESFNERPKRQQV